MPIVESSIEIALPPETVFALTQDYYLRLEWDPFLRDLRFLDGAKGGAAGVRVWVRAWTGLTMTVEYISFNPPRVVAVKMVEGPFFLSSFAGTWRFTAAGQNATRVEFRYGFQTKWKPLRPVLDSLAALIFKRDIRARLRALRHAAEETDIGKRIVASFPKGAA